MTLATQACDLELLQLQTAVENLLSQPARMIAIRLNRPAGQIHTVHFRVKTWPEERGKMHEISVKK